MWAGDLGFDFFYPKKASGLRPGPRWGNCCETVTVVRAHSAAGPRCAVARPVRSPRMPPRALCPPPCRRLRGARRYAGTISNGIPGGIEGFSGVNLWNQLTLLNVVRLNFGCARIAALAVIKLACQKSHYGAETQR
jgi:hypothetical protein